MLTSQIRWKTSGADLVIGLGITGLFCLSAFAEDIGVTPIAPPRGSTVKSTKRKPPPAKPRPTVPRPIQDETSAAVSTSTSPSAPAAPAPRAAPRRSQEEAVNLDALSAPSRPASASGSSSARASPHGPSGGGSGILPNFKFYFDFMLKSWKGGGASSGDLTFDTFHQRLLVEFTPNPDLMFHADLLGQRYFETDYMLSPNLQVRWGRIWIPFDDMSPHAMFGGRINTSEFRQGNETAFLPDIWADLGLGLKWTLSDSPGFSSVLHFYIVNGFQEARGRSPVLGEESGTGTNAPYPTFDGTSGGAGDNNNEKALGARFHSVIGRRFGLGASIYKDSYTDKDVEPLGIFMVGLDAQLRPTNTTEIRMGYTTAKVSLDSTKSVKASYMRGGTYVELGQRFGAEDRWKFLVRAGSAQNDNRVVDVSDKTIVGLTLLKNFGMIEAQVNYFRDLHQVPAKTAYNYGEFRLVTAF